MNILLVYPETPPTFWSFKGATNSWRKKHRTSRWG
jgi:hypothetical protein